ncbi:cilia- and flagella-associated protein 119 isoform X2 [Halichoeres trimaculatus]
MLWTDVSYHDMEQIDRMHSPSDLKSTLSHVFGVDLPEPKREALLALYVHTVLFSREKNFNKEQTSALLSIIKSVHEANTETPLNNIEECFTYCKELLFCHSIRRPPFSINLFSPEEADLIIKHIYNGYIRHYKVYKYIFTPQVKLDLYLTYSDSSNQDGSNVEDPSFEDAENMQEPVGEEPEADSSDTPERPNTEPEDATTSP